MNNKVWATFAGSTPIDMTSNIKIVFNGDIVNGIDFEDQQSIKNNAPLYFASNNKLVTKPDFISYFKGLNSPIRVKNAIAWGQDEIESNGNTTYKYIQNCICYCIASSLYNTKSSIYSAINVLTDNTTNQSGVFSVYGTSNSYLEHLTDYLKFLYSFDSFNSIQYMPNPSEQWLKNIKAIRDKATPKMMMNSKLYSFPPIVQYYDVVGSVSVNSLSKLQEYKKDVENEIYNWLDSNCNFGTKIYKSDLVKFFTKREETSYVDLDIRVSDIIKTPDIKYMYSLGTTSIDNVFLYNQNNNYADNSTENRMFNVIKLPLSDNAGATIDIESIKNKSIKIVFYSNTTDNVNTYSDVIADTIYTSNDCTKTDSNVFITFNGAVEIPSNVTIGEKSTLKLLVTAGKDFYSTGGFSVSNASKYGLDTDQANEVQDFIISWIDNSDVVTEAKRAIPLPYYVSSFDKNTREETITRLGILQNSYSTQLTEKAFWMYVMPYIIREIYGDVATEDINDSTWSYIDNLARDLYISLKATFVDSILDDNNNIVNFSMDNELPVVRLNITYKYGA